MLAIGLIARSRLLFVLPWRRRRTCIRASYCVHIWVPSAPAHPCMVNVCRSTTHLLRTTVALNRNIETYSDSSSVHSRHHVHTSASLHLTIRNLRTDRASETAHIPTTNDIILEKILLPLSAKQYLHEYSKHCSLEFVREVHTHQSSHTLTTEIQFEALRLKDGRPE